MATRIIPIFITILVVAGGCASPKPTTTIAPSPIAPVTPTPTPTPTPMPDRYWDGIERGAGAAAFAQSAQSASDWELVKGRFQNAASILRDVPKSSQHFNDAQTFLKRFNANASDAQALASGKLSAAPASLLDNRLPLRPEEPKLAKPIAPTPFVQPVPTSSASPTPQLSSEPETVRRQRRYYVPKSRPKRLKRSR